MADKIVMGMLDRYKKKGGFVQLLTLIESSGKQKQDQFLGLIAQENPLWEETIRKKSLSIDKIFSWNPVYLGEVLTRVQPLTLATALHSLPKERVETILNCLPVGERRKIQQVIDETNPSPAEKNTCIMKIINETRGFMLGGVVKVDKVDAELVIPDNIEEQLNSANMAKMFSEPAAEPAPTELRFELPTDHKSDHRADHSREEVDFLKKKVNQLVAENTSLKSEVASLRHKLDQIRKIA